jgi:hypothetical protein
LDESIRYLIVDCQAELVEAGYFINIAFHIRLLAETTFENESNKL